MKTRAKRGCRIDHTSIQCNDDENGVPLIMRLAQIHLQSGVIPKNKKVICYGCQNHGRNLKCMFCKGRGFKIEIVAFRAGIGLPRGSRTHWSFDRKTVRQMKNSHVKMYCTVTKKYYDFYGKELIEEVAKARTQEISVSRIHEIINAPD